MTLEETKKFLFTVNALYPSWKVDNPQETAAAWQWALGDYSPEAVMAGLHVYTRTNNKGFAPDVSQIISCIHAPKENAELTEGEAWMMVKKAISDSLYNAEARFDELPPMIQKAVGSPSVLREWGQTDTESVNSVIMSNFQRCYRTVVERQKFDGKIHPQVAEVLRGIEQKQQQMIGGTA